MDGLKICQADTLDELCMPYTFYDDIGVILARHEAGCGDGKWVYNEQLDIVETRAWPYPVVAKFRKRQEILDRARLFIANWSMSDYIKNNTSEAGDHEGDEHEAEQATPPKQEKLKRQRSEPAGAVRLNTTVALVDNNASLIAMCNVSRKKRASNGRIDLNITTPDGCRFRSFSAAVCHMQHDVA